eukprot:g48195.t1
MPALLERPKMSSAMARALHQHIMKERARKRQVALVALVSQRLNRTWQDRAKGLRPSQLPLIQQNKMVGKEEEVDKMMEQKMKEEQERKRKKEMEERMSLEETKEQISKMELKLQNLQEEKHQLFLQLKKVLHEEEKRRAKMKEQSVRSATPGSKFFKFHPQEMGVAGSESVDCPFLIACENVLDCFLELQQFIWVVRPTVLFRKESSHTEGKILYFPIKNAAPIQANGEYSIALLSCAMQILDRLSDLIKAPLYSEEGLFRYVVLGFSLNQFTSHYIKKWLEALDAAKIMSSDNIPVMILKASAPEFAASPSQAVPLQLQHWHLLDNVENYPVTLDSSRVYQLQDGLSKFTKGIIFQTHDHYHLEGQGLRHYLNYTLQLDRLVKTFDPVLRSTLRILILRTSHVGDFYCLPKIHKGNILGCPMDPV